MWRSQLIALLLALQAGAIEPDRLWAEPIATIACEPATYPNGYLPPTYRWYKQSIDSSAPWTLFAETPECVIEGLITECLPQRFTVSAMGTEGPGPRSDPAQWIAYCGSADLDGNGSVAPLDFSWFARFYLHRRLGAEWVQ